MRFLFFHKSLKRLDDKFFAIFYVVENLLFEYEKPGIDDNVGVSNVF